MGSKVQRKRSDKRNKVKGQRIKMRFHIGLITTLLTYYLSLSTIQAQEATPVTGGNASGSGGTVSYTVGQVVYSSNTGSNGSVAQGVQQPFEISVVTTIEEAKGISLCMAYPNPTTDYVVLKIDGDIKTEYIASLFDINGKLLESRKIKGNETIIVMDNLVSAVYFLKVINNNKEVKTFKIIKK
jgi:Secretion system C-terminal sorting domain